MRKIEGAMCEAVKRRTDWKSGNTEVKNTGNGLMFVYLHGNLIAMIRGTLCQFTLAGWNTNTTRSRLNALGCGISQRNYLPVHRGRVIDANEWYNTTL